MADEDTLDTSTATDTGAPDSAAATATLDTPQTTTPEASTETSPAPTGEAPAPSTTDSRGSQQSTTPEAKPPVDWQSRYRELQSYADRRSAQYTQHREELQRKVQELEAFKAQQEKQAAAKRWQPAHPEHAKFKGLLTSAKTVYRQLQDLDRAPIPQGVSPEQHAQNIEFAKQRITAGISAEEQQVLAEYQTEMNDWQNKLFTEPEEAIGPIAERIARQVFTQLQQQQQDKMQVQEDFSQPHLKPILENPKYASFLNERLQAGVPYEHAMETLKLRAAVDMMAARLSGADRMATHAQEQTRLAQGRAARTTTADPAPAPVDPYAAALKEAKAKGILPGTPAFNRLIDKHERANAS